LRYGTGGDYARMGLEESGRQFFDECRRNIESAVYPDDRAKVAAVLDKKKLVAILGVQKSFSMDYRLLIGGEPVFYRMKITSPTPHNLRHLIIGVSNVDAQITDAQKLEAARQSAATYSRIAQALATDYFSIYCVDTTDDSFIEYSENTEYTGLGIEKQGEDFFGKSRKNILRVVHPDDQEMVRSALNKAYMLEAMRETGSFTLTYRLMIGGEATYVHLKATRLGNESDPNIVIGVSNIDAQMKREQKHSQELRDAKEMILRDALTGVKSKTAFTAAETQWNEKLAASAAEPFAVAVCDVNSLKAVNDTLGHKAGDEIIRRACSLICNTFKHSPVYRIGGDEFAVILSGRDYERRQELLSEMDAQNRENVACGDVVIACGAADYEPGTDTGIEAVFERADARMYDNKAALKAAGL
ncbi:MAG: diguanylate cyclase, partial [Clostridia bacterium]|nr:diguanylate cyclase [Clostridia bacterium]